MPFNNTLLFVDIPPCAFISPVVVNVDEYTSLNGTSEDPISRVDAVVGKILPNVEKPFTNTDPFGFIRTFPEPAMFTSVLAKISIVSESITVASVDFSF